MIVNRNDFHRTKMGLMELVCKYLPNSSYDQMEVNLATRLIEKRRQYYKDGVIALDCGANMRSTYY